MSRTFEKDVYERVTQKIVEAMERGDVPWVQPWTTALPFNAVSRRPYRGINVLSTWAHQLEGGYRSNAYVTYKQAKDLGGQVRRGEHGVTVVFYKQVPRPSRESTVETERERGHFWLARGYTLFNLDQVDGLDDLRLSLKSDPVGTCEPLEESERIVARCEVIVCVGDRASYSPAADIIMMPPLNSFRHVHAYVSTLLHECGHATGAPHRLNRDLTGRFGDPRYAMEELIAELTAAFVGARIGIEQVSQAPAYVASWLAALKEDRKIIFTAAKLAAAAADFLASDGQALDPGIGEAA